MAWKTEIIRAFFVAFGTMQTISNVTYLVKKNGYELATKQHKELPDNITKKEIKNKNNMYAFFWNTFFINRSVFVFYSFLL